ncbi:MAG: winged helix-turn-helix transcriptional regulator [Calditrichaeota bacterium]|nr:winged helix-turn-helix transcriptional regulator [Calditrichota bacterium]
MRKSARMSDPRSRFFMALACDQRLKILELLREKERCSCELVPLLKLDPSVVSRHLSLLREAGMIEGRKEGINIYYAITDKRVFDLLDISKQIIQDWFEKRRKLFEMI